MRKTLTFFLFISLPIILSACSFSLVSDVTPPPGSEVQPSLKATQPVPESSVYPIVPPNLADGAQIYSQNCAKCHGNKGLGDGPQASQLTVSVTSLGLTDIARLYSPADWYTIVTQGNMEEFMPAFSSLTDRQRWDVVAYAMNLSTTATQISRGQELYQQNCTLCHGQTGAGDGAYAASLSTQPTNFTRQSIMARISASSLYQDISTGVSPDMPAFENSLDEDDRWALAAYLRSLTYASLETAQVSYPAPVSSTATGSNQTTGSTPGAYTASVSTQSAPITPTVEITPTATFTGSVAVQLINGSGGTAPSDVPVTLYGFDDMQNTYSETLTSGMNGVYNFSNVSMPEGRVFLAGTNYASGTYGSDIVTVNPTTPNLNLQITVYDTTTDLSALTAERVHILFDFTQPKIAQVFEVFIISNPSKQAIISANQDGSVVTFPLPAGYSNLQFQDGELGGRYLAIDKGFADTSTITPGVGAYTVVFGFQMPYDRQLNFSQPMALPTSAVVVLIPDNGVKVVSDRLQDSGTLDYNGVTYHKYDGSSLAAGSSLAFSLSGNPSGASGTSGSTLFNAGTMQSLAIGLGTFGVAIVAVGIWLYRRNQLKLATQRSIEDLATAGSQSDDEVDDENTLMDAIIALDDQYNAGNLPEEAYLERRAVLKSRLRNLHRD